MLGVTGARPRLTYCLLIRTRVGISPDSYIVKVRLKGYGFCFIFCKRGAAKYEMPVIDVCVIVSKMRIVQVLCAAGVVCPLVFRGKRAKRDSLRLRGKLPVKYVRNTDAYAP